MKLLKRYSTLFEAELVMGLLRSNGILAVISEKYIHYSYVVPVRIVDKSVGLWIVIDTQYEDALKLLANPDHIPSVKLTDAEMQELELSPVRTASKWINLISTIIVNTILGTVLMLLVGYVLYNVM